MNYELKYKMQMFLLQVIDSASVCVRLCVSVHMCVCEMSEQQSPAIASITTQMQRCCSGTPCGLCKYQIPLPRSSLGSWWEPRLSSQPECVWSDMI